MDKRNICTLIASQQNLSLPKNVLRFWHFQRNKELNDPYSPYFTAAWFLFRNQTEKLEIPDRRLFETLLWASEYAEDARDVYNKAPSDATNDLKKALCKFSREKYKTLIEKPGKKLEDQILRLWANVFAPVLEIGPKEEQLPIVIGFFLARFGGCIINE